MSESVFQGRFNGASNFLFGKTSEQLSGASDVPLPQKAGVSAPKAILPLRTTGSPVAPLMEMHAVPRFYHIHEPYN